MHVRGEIVGVRSRIIKFRMLAYVIDLATLSGCRAASASFKRPQNKTRLDMQSQLNLVQIFLFKKGKLKQMINNDNTLYKSQS